MKGLKLLMNNIIPQNNKRYLPHDLKTKENAVITYRNCNDINYVCRKYHISRTSLWRWNKKYDGTKESLLDGSHKPKSEHPNAHTLEEINRIKRLVKRNPHATINEIWYKMKRKYLYSRSITSLYRITKKMKKEKVEPIKGTSKRKHNQKYHTPQQMGEKWQVDVKYVPKICKASHIPEDLNFYQYTCIDEATRERYLYWYEEHTPENTVDFIKRCIEYFGYKPKEIQTDNGTEFSYNSAKIKKKHPMDVLLDSLEIKHHKIRPRTPEHNGKVERSHRNDNERFYTFLEFHSIKDLREKGAKYVKRSNSIPMAVLGYLTPKEKRRSLEKSLVILAA